LSELKVSRVRGDLLYGSLDGFEVVYDKGTESAVFYGDGCLEMETGHHELHVHVLAAVRGFTIVSSKTSIRANAIAIEGGLGGLSFGASRGVDLELEPGRLYIYTRGSLRIARPASLLVASRLMHEDSLVLEEGETCGRGLGHLRSSSSIVILSELGDSFARFIAYSPAGDGSLEVRWFSPVRRVIEHDVYGESEIPVGGELFRVPLPYGSCKEIRIEYERGLLARLRLARP
jgi:hypothetical protein